jgi:phage-related protein
MAEGILRSILPDLGEIFKDVGETLQSIAEAFEDSKGIESMEKTGKEMGKPKFKKSVDALAKMFKSLILAGPKAFILEKLMQLLEPFLSIIELLNPLFEVLAAIFQEALIPLIEELNPIIMELVDILLDNKDIIIDLIRIGLMPLLFALRILMKIIQENREVIDELFEALRPVIKEIGELISVLMEEEEIMIAVVAGIKALAFLLGLLVSGVKSTMWAFEGLKNVLKAVRDFINTISFSGGGGNGGGDDDDDGGWWPFATGAYVPSRAGGTKAIVGEGGEGEWIIPESKMGGADPETLYYAEQTSNKLDTLIEVNLETNRKLRRQRNR